MKKSDHERNAARTEAFGDMLYAAMQDAAQTRALTQLKVEITPEGQSKPRQIRIVILPEQMDQDFPQGLESQTKPRSGHQ